MIEIMSSWIGICYEIFNYFYRRLYFYYFTEQKLSPKMQLQAAHLFVPNWYPILFAHFNASICQIMLNALRRVVAPASRSSRAALKATIQKPSAAFSSVASLEGYGQHLFKGVVAHPYLEAVGLPKDTLDTPAWTKNSNFNIFNSYRKNIFRIFSFRSRKLNNFILLLRFW